MVDSGTTLSKATAPLFQGGVLMFLGAFVSYYGYLENSAVINVDEVLGPAMFWFAALMILFRIPFRRPLQDGLRALRTIRGAAVFGGYLVLHLLVYGFLLELIFTAVYGVAFALTPSISFSTDAFMPPSVLNALADVAYSPSVSFTLPPALSGALSLYSIAVALVVAVLVLVNMVKIVDLGRYYTRARRTAAYFLVPAVGLVLGAACCLSVPALISFVAPSVLYSETFVWVSTITYFFFPFFAVVVLYLNLRAVERIAARVREAGTGLDDPRA